MVYRDVFKEIQGVQHLEFIRLISYDYANNRHWTAHIFMHVYKECNIKPNIGRSTFMVGVRPIEFELYIFMISHNDIYNTGSCASLKLTLPKVEKTERQWEGSIII